MASHPLPAPCVRAVASGRRTAVFPAGDSVQQVEIRRRMLIVARWQSKRKTKKFGDHLRMHAKAAVHQLFMRTDKILSLFLVII